MKEGIEEVLGQKNFCVRCVRVCVCVGLGVEGGGVSSSREPIALTLEYRQL